MIKILVIKLSLLLKNKVNDQNIGNQTFPITQNTPSNQYIPGQYNFNFMVNNMYSNQTNVYNSGDDIFDLEGSYFTEYTNNNDYSKDNIQYNKVDQNNVQQNPQDDIFGLEDSLFDQYTTIDYNDQNDQYNTQSIDVNNNFQTPYNTNQYYNPTNSEDFQIDNGNENENLVNEDYDNSNLESFFGLFDGSNDDIEDDTYGLYGSHFSTMYNEEEQGQHNQYTNNSMEIVSSPSNYPPIDEDTYNLRDSVYSTYTDDNSFYFDHFDMYNEDTNEDKEEDTYNLRYFF